MFFACLFLTPLVNIACRLAPFEEVKGDATLLMASPPASERAPYDSSPFKLFLPEYLAET